MDAPTQWLFWWSGAYLVAGLGFALVQRLRARRIVGRVTHRARLDRSRYQPAIVGLVVLVAVGVLVLPAAEPVVPALILLALGAALTLVVPADQDAVCGTEGVRRGWHARRLSELEEWRLTGDHLRFRLYGEWTSVELPTGHHIQMRERLERGASERESAFTA